MNIKYKNKRVEATLANKKEEIGTNLPVCRLRRKLKIF